MTNQKQVIVVGAGIAGMTAALFLAEQDVSVTLISRESLNTSASVILDSGFNVALNFSHDGDEIDRHIEETLSFGQGLFSKDFIKKLCLRSTEAFNILSRMGVEFARTEEGNYQTQKSAGSKHRRQLYSKVSLGHQISQALFLQVLSAAQNNKIKILEGWELLSVALDHNQKCQGVVIQELKNMKIQTLVAQAVIVAVGSMGGLYGKNACVPQSSHGATIGQLFQQGTYLTQMEFASFNPYCIQLSDLAWPMPARLIHRDTQLWIEQDGQRQPFLPHDNLQEVPACEILKKLHQHYDLKTTRLYLDFKSLPTHDQEFILKNTGIDPKLDLVPLTTALEATLGGLWVDLDHMTNLPGIFAAGDCTSSYLGINPLPGNHLPALWTAGLEAAASVCNYVKELSQWADATHTLEHALQIEETRHSDYIDLSGPENIYVLFEELYKLTHHSLGLVRSNAQIHEASDLLISLKEKSQRVAVRDKSNCYNHDVLMARYLEQSLDLIYVMLRSSLYRNETRGFHFKQDYPSSDDGFFKLSKAQWTPEMPEIFYEDVCQIQKMDWQTKIAI